jgi:hypothetical protein
LEKIIQNAIDMSEKNKLSSLAMPILGAKSFSMDVLLIFKVLLRKFQEDFFKKKTYLKEILIYVEDRQEIDLICSFVKKAVVEKQFSDLTQKLYQWSWKNNNGFERYDQEIEDKVHMGYQSYLENNSNSRLIIEFDINRKPGTHAFDLENNIVINTVLGTQEKLTFNKVWFHNNDAYNNSISNFLSKKLKEGNKTLNLFLNSYIIDFSKMQQINQITGYIREIKKEDDKNNISVSVFKMLNYKLRILPKYVSVFIKNFHGENRHLIVKGAIQLILDKYFQKYPYILPQNLHQQKIKALENICETEKIDLLGELIPEGTISLVGSKQAIQKFIEETKKVYFLWDDNGKELVELNSSDKEYKFVETIFNETMKNRKIISIQRNQNKDLYLLYQDNIQSLKKIKKNYEAVQSKKNKMERYLWHGTSTIDPMALIQGLNTISTQFAKDECMWGRALYFAVNASYSDSYAYKTKNETKKLLLCLVYTGDYIKQEPDRTLRQPPIRINGINLTYDSIKGNTSGSDIFVLYKDHRNYPHYLVEFK